MNNHAGVQPDHPIPVLHHLGFRCGGFQLDMQCVTAVGGSGTAVGRGVVSTSCTAPVQAHPSGGAHDLSANGSRNHPRHEPNRHRRLPSPATHTQDPYTGHAPSVCGTGTILWCPAPHACPDGP